MLSRVTLTAKNVGYVFLRHTVEALIFLHDIQVPLNVSSNDVECWENGKITAVMNVNFCSTMQL